MKIDYDFFTQLKPLPESRLSFTFRYPLTDVEIKLLQISHAHTSLGFRWFFLTSDDIWLYRGTQFYYSVHLNRKTHHHSATAYIYADEDNRNIDEWLSNHHPIEALNVLFKRWIDESLCYLEYRKERLEEIQKEGHPSTE